MSTKPSAPPSQTTTTVQKSDPWAQQQPHLERVMSEAERLYGAAGPNYFPGSTVAGFTPQQSQAYTNIEALANQGSPLLSSARDTNLAVMRGDYASPLLSGTFDPRSPDIPLLADTAGGRYLGKNPTLDATYKAASDPLIRDWKTSILPSVNRSVAGSNATGSGMHGWLANNSAENLGRNLASLSANIYGTDYENERNRMLGATTAMGSAYRGEAGLMDAASRGRVADIANAAAAAPGLDATKYSDSGALLNVGQAYQGLDAAQLQDEINRWNFGEQLPANKLAQYLQLVSGNYGGTGTSTSDVTSPLAPSNPWLGGLSGALSGAGIGASIPGLGPWGAAGGGVLGGLLGLLGNR